MVPRWHPAVETYLKAVAATKTGMYGALGFAGWVGIPAIVTLDRVRTGVVSPLETTIIVILVGIALLTAWRFHTQNGWVVGPILLVALVIEVGKRLVQTFYGMLSFGIFDAAVVFMISVGLLNGIRGARAFKTTRSKDKLTGVFE